MVGERVFTAWSNASGDLQAFIQTNAAQIRELATALLKRAGGSVVSVLMFVVSLIIAGGFMTFAEGCGSAAQRFFVRIGGPELGGELAPMTWRPYAACCRVSSASPSSRPSWLASACSRRAYPARRSGRVIVLFLAIAQLPPLIILAPIMVYMFSTADTTAAVIFTVYQLVAGASDSFLKPLLMGRGLDIPMPVILIGAIGGMIMSGIIGLFAGAVILSIFYKLFGLWIDQQAG